MHAQDLRLMVATVQAAPAQTDPIPFPPTMDGSSNRGEEQKVTLAPRSSGSLDLLLSLKIVRLSKCFGRLRGRRRGLRLTAAARGISCTRHRRRAKATEEEGWKSRLEVLEVDRSMVLADLTEGSELPAAAVAGELAHLRVRLWGPCFAPGAEQQSDEAQLAAPCSS